MDSDLNEAFEALAELEVSKAYAERHGVAAQPNLTITDDETASLVSHYLASRVKDKTVIEVGGGIGILSLHLGLYARRVFCIEANPVWSSYFVSMLLAVKPANVSYLFGAAEEFAGHIRGDVAIICTHSGLESMKQVAASFAPVVIDVYGELIASNPSAFDPLARELRRIV